MEPIRRADSSFAGIMVIVALLGASPLFSQAKKQAALIVDEELPGLTKSAGYDFPDEVAGKQLYPESYGYIRISPIAKAYDSHALPWVLCDSPKSDAWAWVPAESILFIDEKAFDKLPVFDKLPKTGYAIPERFPADKTVEGATGSPSPEGVVAFPPSPVPAYVSLAAADRGPPDFMVPPGRKVRGLALLADGSDALVQVEGYKQRLWIMSMQITWKGCDWMGLKDSGITILQPSILGKVEYPAIAKPRKPPEPMTPEGPLGEDFSLVIRDTLGAVHPWNALLPAEWAPGPGKAAKYELVIRKDPVVVEVVRYSPWGTFERVRVDYDAILSSNDTKLPVGMIVLQGRDPPPAPERMLPGKAYNGVGEGPSPDALVSWIRSLEK